jgi:two-component system sensor histidine kinase PilS (NtrC family)
MQHGADPDGQVHITLSVEHTRQGMRLNVSDTGVGIPYSKREVVFEPFFTTRVTGNGMGLFIAKDLCELNGARLFLNQVEHGCCFSLIFNHRNEIQL